MKKSPFLRVLFALFCLSQVAYSATSYNNSLLQKNTKTSVTQVTTAVVVSEDEDFVVTGTPPFAESGSVNIVNTEHGVLILEKVRPSVTIGTLLAKYVQVNGEQARNGVNCQVRLYGTLGSMILPYAATDKPLTVYSEQQFAGEACSDFGLENDGGYMVTLTDAKLNNRIRSFRLKRGYMVTFATQPSGYGYQRCFIANDRDLEMATLPQILDGKISSYRIFKWNTAGKKGLASNGDAAACKALNVISCYGWDTGHDMYPDVECVANHLYEDYPSSSACGKATWTAHMKTNNEPRNSSDDHPQSLSTILSNWQNLMRTGMRLCSPSSWDGSDYTDGTGFLKQFFDSIDARGWRCDIADLHCYWLVDTFDKIGAMQSKYKRPIWVSEWIWGASWNKNGIFESGKTKWDNEWAVKTICTKMNSMPYVERYFYWNSEGGNSKLYEGGSLTPAGTWYANQLTGMGYNPNYEKIPNTPRMRGGFRDFHVATSAEKATITWHEYDGEYNQLMELLRKEPDGAWQSWKTITPQDAEADYLVEDATWHDGVRYRLHIKSFSGREYYSSQDMEPGEAIEMADGTLRYVGGNVIPNGQFRMGLFGLTDGTGKMPGQPWFEVFPQGRSDGYFLQAFGNQGKDGEASLKTAFPIVPGQDYVLRLANQNAGDYVKLDVRHHGASTDANRLTMKNQTYWNTQQAVFNSGEYDEALLSFRWLGGTAQFADIELCPLFDTREKAIDDAFAQLQTKLSAVTAWNKVLPALNDELKARTTALPTNKEEALYLTNLAIEDLLQAVADKQAIDSLLLVASHIAYMNFEGRDELQEAITAGTAEWPTAAAYAEARLQLEECLQRFLLMSPSQTQPQNADFAATDGWLTKVGTYQGGDQRTATHDGKTCWNAWWSNIEASQGTAMSMEIQQKIGGLPEGLYSLECKAATQHYCLSDQHGYLSTATETAVTPILSRDYLDVPGTVSPWQTLTTTPVYVSASDTLTIGFVGTKEQATDNAWHRYGKPDESPDKREGWWCATDFRLLYHPVFRFDVTPAKWGTICLPYYYRVPDGIRLYRIAGLLSDYSRIAIEEVVATAQGVPYIYVADQSPVTYYTEGEPVAHPDNSGTNNLYGTFLPAGRVAEGRYVLGDDGEWYRVSGDNRPQNVAYTAVIRRADGIPVLEEWEGLTMPIHGVIDELGDPNAIAPVEADAAAPSTTPQHYLLDGRRSSTKPSGIYIQRNGKHTVKRMATSK